MLAPLLHLDASSYCHGRGIFTFQHNLIMDVDIVDIVDLLRFKDDVL